MFQTRFPFVPIPAWHLAAIADSFFDAKLWLHGFNRSSEFVTDIRSKPYVLIRSATKRSISAASSGILGMRRYGESLYVALDPAVDEPMVAVRTACTTMSSAGLF